MSDRAQAPFDELNQQLVALAPWVAFPPTPDLADRVRAAIESAPSESMPVVSTNRYRSYRFLAAAACVLLIGIGVLLAIFPSVRSSVARHLGLPGIDIVVVDGTATVVPSAAGNGLLLGERMSLGDAQLIVDYQIGVPTALGEPDEVYLRQLDSGPMVTLLYYPREELPDTAESGVGALLMQFPATEHPGSLAKLVSMGFGRVSETDVGDDIGFWVTGESQLILDQDPSKSFDDLIARDSGNVLLWQRGAKTFRLESALTLSDALAIAESMPVPDGTATP